MSLLDDMLKVLPERDRTVPDAMKVGKAVYERMCSQMNRLAAEANEPCDTILGVKVFKSDIMPSDTVAMMNWNKDRRMYEVVKIVKIQL